MSKVINEQGNHYGMITVNERGPNDNNGKAQWFCTCECGNTFLARGTDLRRNKILTCGCTSYNKGQALVGQKFGKLTVIKKFSTIILEFQKTKEYFKSFFSISSVLYLLILNFTARTQKIMFKSKYKNEFDESWLMSLNFFLVLVFIF